MRDWNKENARHSTHTRTNKHATDKSHNFRMWMVFLDGPSISASHFQQFYIDNIIPNPVICDACKCTSHVWILHRYISKWFECNCSQSLIYIPFVPNNRWKQCGPIAPFQSRLYERIASFCCSCRCRCRRRYSSQCKDANLFVRFTWAHTHAPNKYGHPVVKCKRCPEFCWSVKSLPQLCVPNANVYICKCINQIEMYDFVSCVAFSAYVLA